MEFEALKEFGRRYAEAWCSQDASRVAAHFAPQGSLKVNDAQPTVGREAIREVAQGFMSAFPDIRVIMDEAVPGTERAIFRWTLIGTNTGPGGTGKRVRISGYEEWKMSEDGLIADSLGHFDGADYERQLKHGAGDAA